MFYCSTTPSFVSSAKLIVICFARWLLTTEQRLYLAKSTFNFKTELLINTLEVMTKNNLSLDLFYFPHTKPHKSKRVTQNANTFYFYYPIDVFIGAIVY